MTTNNQYLNMSPHHATSSGEGDSNNDIIDISTAPTTPYGSVTFSPILQCLNLDDEPLLGVPTEISAHHSVKNVCFVGAGYVGMFKTLLPQLLVMFLGSCCLTGQPG